MSVEDGMPPPAIAKARRRRRLLRRLGAAAAAVVLGGLLVVAFWIAMTVGLFDGIGRPSPDSPAVAAARRDAQNQLDDRLQQALDGSVRQVMGGEVLATGEEDRCTPGQNNWKVHQGYQLSCTLTKAIVVTGGPIGTFREDMQRLDSALGADGWEPSGAMTMARVLSEYWDSRDSVHAQGASFTYPTDLPAAGYQTDSTRLSVEWAQRGVAVFGPWPYPIDDPWVGPEGAMLGNGEVTAAVPADHYALVVSLWMTYYEK